MKAMRIDFTRKGSGQCMRQDCDGPSAIPVTTGAERLELCVVDALAATDNDGAPLPAILGCPRCGAETVPHTCRPAEATH